MIGQACRIPSGQSLCKIPHIKVQGGQGPKWLLDMDIYINIYIAERWKEGNENKKCENKEGERISYR